MTVNCTHDNYRRILSLYLSTFQRNSIHGTVPKYWDGYALAQSAITVNFQTRAPHAGANARL